MFRFLLFISLFSTNIYSQSLTFSSSGQTGLSGTNWSISGSNPVKISSTDTSSINVSVLQGYLTSGVDVIINSVGNLIINSDITKTNSGRLIMRSGTNSISGTGKIILGNSAQLLINPGATISNNIELNSGASTIGFAPIEVEYLIVAGGGSGGVGRGGGGGAGGVLTGSTEISSGSYTIVVGAGGNTVTNDNRGINGSNSSAFSLTAIGGGAGGGWVSGSESGQNGGSGGGASASPFSAGTGTAGQGNNGFSLNYYREPGGGGGGAGSAAASQNGGNGIVLNITGNSKWYGGGGGAGALSSGASLAGLGGNGGGGNGTKVANGTASSGQANTGGGGGGTEGFNGVSGAGGSGIVVFRYLGADVSTADTEYVGSNFATGYQVNEFRQTGSRTFSINASLFQGEVSGQITGSGNLVLNPGSGNITITGANLYSGNTTIESGSIQLGNNGTQGNLGSGNIENKGQLQLNRSNSLTFSNIISGTGSIKQIGSGSLIFTQNNTYSGTTTISSGVLQIGDSTTTGSFGTGDIINNSSIIIKRTNDLTLSNLISGTGTLTKELSNTLTLTQNNTYSGNTTINGGILVLQNNAPNPTSKTYLGIGQLRIEPSSASFTSAFSNSGWSFNSTLSGITIGKSNNTSNVTVANSSTIAGPITIYGGSINVNENLNTSGGGTNGDILLKASADVSLAATKTITTSGGDVILWSNSDNAATNGSIALRSGSSIITGSNSVVGGSIWIGGGSDSSSWNGLTVGSGYAVPGTVYTPSNGGGSFASAIYLEQNSLSSFGGNIKIAGDGVATSLAIVTYGNTISINSGPGTIEIEGQVSSSAAGNRNGILIGLHDLSRLSLVTISSSSPSDDAIKITGVARGSGDAIGISGTVTITSSGGGNIVLNGNALGTGRSIVVGNYYHGILNLYANSGDIVLNGNTKAVQVANAVSNGFTTGPSKINIGQGGTISTSTSDVVLTGDNIALAAGGIAINTSGKVTLEPFSNSFSSAISYPISSLSMANTISGLTIGKLTNNSNISFTANQTVAGTISAYGGQINLGVGVNLTTTTLDGHITLLGKNGFVTDANTGTTRGKIMTSGGGNITINADADDNNVGDLDLDWLTIDGNSGDILIEAATFNWSTFSGVTYPEFYGTGALTFRGTSSSAYSFNLGWLALFNTKSSITIGGASSANTASVDITPCATCNNTADNYTGKTIQVNGPLTIYGTTIGINQNINVNNSGTISLFGNALNVNSSNTISSTGNLVISPKSNATTIGIAGAAGTLSLPATYFSSNFGDGFSNIQIGSNNQSGNISANAFTLRDHITLLTSGALSLGGKPILENNNVTLGSSISSISGMPTHYFQTNGSGKMITTLANNTSRIFPVGNTSYNPVTITNNTGNSDTFSVRVIDSVSGNGTQGNAITTPHVKATWNISKSNANSGSGIDMQFSWQSSQEIGGISNFVLNHHNGRVWEKASGTASSVSGTTTKTLSQSGYTGTFSPFAFGPSVTPLPIELVEFKASCANDFVEIQWTTASEKKNDRFELYKSNDAKEWIKIYTVKGQGTKSSETQYQFNDYNKETEYYRLKDIDFNGIENWSSIIYADCKSNISKTEIYPNPATDYIKVSTEIDDQSIIRIIDMDGRQVKSLSLISKQSLIDVKELIAGAYIIEIDKKGQIERIKFIKQ